MGIKDLVKDLRDRVDGLRKRGRTEVRSIEDGTKTVKLSEEASDLLGTLSSELGPRPAASLESRRAARRIASEMEKHTDDVTLTSGRIYPYIGKGMMLFLYVFTLFSLIFAFAGLPYISLLAAALYLYALYGEIAKDGGWLRAFMRTGEAANVHAVIESEEEAERTIIFSAHHDSAPIRKEREGKFWRLASWRYLQPASFALAVAASAFAVVSELIRGVFWGFNLPSLSIALLLLLSLASSIVSFIAFDMKEGEYSVGAGDNLSGVSVVITLLSHFAKEKKEGRGLKKTRLIFVSFDGEECGRAGSRLWYRDNVYLLHRAENLNFDGLYDEDDLVFLAMDGNGFVPLSSSFASRCSALAASMGYKVGIGRIGLLGGETDAASAALASVEATTLSGMPPGKESPAHTEEDTPDKVSEETLSRAIAIGIRVAEEEKEGERKEDSPFSGDRKYKLSRY